MFVYACYSKSVIDGDFIGEGGGVAGGLEVMPVDGVVVGDTACLSRQLHDIGVVVEVLF